MAQAPLVSALIHDGPRVYNRLVQYALDLVSRYILHGAHQQCAVGFHDALHQPDLTLKGVERELGKARLYLWAYDVAPLLHHFSQLLQVFRIEFPVQYLELLLVEKGSEGTAKHIEESDDKAKTARAHGLFQAGNGVVGHIVQDQTVLLRKKVLRIGFLCLGN